MACQSQTAVIIIQWRQLTAVLALPSEHTLRDYTHLGASFSWIPLTHKWKMKRTLTSFLNIRSKSTYLLMRNVLFMTRICLKSLDLSIYAMQTTSFWNLSVLRLENHSPMLPLTCLFSWFVVCSAALRFLIVKFQHLFLSGKLLFPIVLKCIKQLEAIGFKVIALTSDSASPTANFSKIYWGIGLVQD